MTNSFKFKSLTPEQRHILLDKGTDQPINSDRYKPKQFGTFLCRACGQALFRAEHQFQSSCGWPSFDNEIKGTIERQKDSDGQREEIICSQCASHLGHVFKGEYLTTKNLRHCVNSTSLDFVTDTKILISDEIIIAGGCFWGIEHLMSLEIGVVKAESGYIGGQIDSPTYQLICRGDSGHYEAVRVVFDSALTSADTLYKVFFELHDPFQFDGQGVDRGSQYKSAIFTYSSAQSTIVDTLIYHLEKTYNQEVSTVVLPMTTFWLAEESHQNYFNKHPGHAICHQRTKRFFI